MAYDWSGNRILQKHTSLIAARFVLGHDGVAVSTDLREWIVSGARDELDRVVRQMKLPVGGRTGTFDDRARTVWEWVVREVRYVGDEGSQRVREFWQFPEETLALRQGDCEDTTVLLVSLLMAAGISPFCVRAVIGWLEDGAGGTPHAWPVYKDETGVWRILESTLGADDLPDAWPAADVMASKQATPRYLPDLCFNNAHVWNVRDVEIPSVAEYVAAFRARRSAGRSSPRPLADPCQGGA